MPGHNTLLPGAASMSYKGSQNYYGYNQPPAQSSMTFSKQGMSFAENGASMYNMGGMPGHPPANQFNFNAPTAHDPNWNRQARFSGSSSHAGQQFNFTANAQLPGPHPGRAGKTECHDDCAEEECGDDDQCGNEQRPPSPDHLWCGIDSRPLLPFGLGFLTLFGAVCMLAVQVPLCVELFDLPVAVARFMYGFVALLYGTTITAMIYSALADPGQLPVSESGELLIDHNDSFTDADEEAGDRKLPKRAHKCWQYERPVRRYDHYCKWLTNVIGLLNHREFIIMVSGLVAIGVAGFCFDVFLAIAQSLKVGVSLKLGVVLLHLLVSGGLNFMAGPILRIHIGLVSRNEVANEWKKNTNYIVKECSKGENVEVNDLSDDEHNALFEAFVYDKSKNQFDKGLHQNCWIFWCTPRWGEDQLGEF